MTAPRRICSISVDLDPLDCYHRIHALGEVPEALRDVILRRGLQRFLDLLARRGLPATFFVVGEDLVPGSRTGTAAGREIVRQAGAAGHELASHSHTHPYELVRMERARVEAEIDSAHAAIASLGAPPVGFRSPGYNLSPVVIDVLAARGYRYDSSILPAPLYYGAKAAVMGAMTIARRPSGSTLGDPRFLLAPPRPYRPALGAPWRRGDAPLVELPISVTRGLRVPIIGTYLVAAPRLFRERLLAEACRATYFNFELHGVDLVGAEEDGIPAALVAKQPDLRVPLADKLRALEEALDRLGRADFAFEPIRDAAARFSSE